MIQNIITIVRDLSGNDFLYFDDALIVKMSPHDHQSFRFWAVCVSPGGQLFVMDAFENWYEVKETDEALIQSLFQRVSIIHHKMTA
jgi:hypothetical protein